MSTQEPKWRTSSYSGPNGNCVEVAVGPEVLVRDTKDRGTVPQRYTRTAWHAFVRQLCN